MTTEQSPVEAIFFAALEKGAPAERVAYLDAACGNDDNLRQRVDRLLAAHPQVGSFLEPPARDEVGAAEAPTIPPREKSPAGLGQTETAPYESPVEDVGAVIGGKYKLLETLGQGGMGAVFMAQQTQPVKRLVALKLIKLGMDSKQVLARFGAERQALALMDHPNIAKVLDAGTTDSGRPFFVMELVKGVPITRFCDERQLSPRQRLELFIPVCQAIQHAHQKGIIHRDIKPSNVLVALYDDRPVPKVIDFGVAKATGQQLTDASLMTGFGGVVGTPEYMSPEQAQLNQLDIDTRSDVYALGVLLYELLTGTTPIDRKRLGQGALFEVLRIIREEEPPRPSTRLSTSDALASIAATRRTEPARLAKLMRGELDWIVMKALEKDRTRRYESASGLASDVERYLHDEPVEAGPPSARYRLRKLARRYRRGLLVAGAFALLLVAGAAVSAWEAYQARRAEQAAVQDRDRAVSAEQAASREQARASAAEVGAVAAKEQTQDALAASLYEQARAVRLSGLPGRRWRVLELLKKSEHLRSRERPDPSRLPGKEQLADQHEFLSRAQLRSEAVAALLLEDAHVVRQWSGIAHSVSPDGNLAATEWVDAKTGAVALEITELKTGQGISKWDGDDAMPFIGTAIALGPNGKRLAVVMPPMPIGGRKVSSGGINVWELPGRTLLRELSLPKQGGNASQTKPPTTKAGAMELLLARAIIPSLRFSPNGRYVCGVTASIAGNRVVVWDLEGDGTGHVAGNVPGLASAAFNPDSSLLALASSEKKVVLWNTVRNRVEREIQLPLESTGAVGFAPDGSLGITCAPPKPGSRPNGKQTLLIWDIAQNREIKRITAVPNATTGISFSPDGTHVAMGSGSVGSILVFDLTGANAAISLEHQFALQLLAWTHDSRRLLSGGFGSLKMWQFSDESLLSDLQLEVEPGASFQGPLAFSPNGRFIAIEGRESGHVDIYDRTTRKRVRHLPNDASDKLPALRLLFSPDEKQLVRLGLVSVDVWNVETGTRQSRLIANPSQGQMFESVGLRADGTVVVGASESVLDVGSGKVIWRAPSGSGSAVNVSSDGRFATTCLSVTAGNQEPYSLVDLNTGQSRFQLVGPPPTPMTTYEFSPDSRWLLVLHIEGLAGAGPASAGSMFLGSGTGERKWTGDVWDVQSGKRHMQVGGPSDPESYAFSRDGEYLAVGMTTGAFRVWEMNRREELFDWHPFGDHPASPIISHYLAFATDDACLAVPSPISPAFQILNLRNANKQLGKAALSW